MNKIIPVILALVIVSGMNYAFAEYDYDEHPIEEYDLSGHPIYQEWEYNPDANFSSERFSNPKASNEYHLKALSPFIDPDYDPTHVYLEKRISTFDYCELESFAKYPKCR